MFLGIDALEHGNQLRIYFGEKISWLDQFIDMVSFIFDWLIPLGADVRKIKAKYDRTIEAFFNTFRFLNTFGYISVVIIIGLLITHMADYQYSYTELCTYYIPCFFFFSRFSTNYGWVYSMIYIIFALVGLILFLSKWVKFDILSKR